MTTTRVRSMVGQTIRLTAPLQCRMGGGVDACLPTGTLAVVVTVKAMSQLVRVHTADGAYFTTPKALLTAIR